VLNYNYTSCIKPANKSRDFKRHTPLNPLLIEGKAEDIQIRGVTGIGKVVQAGKQPGEGRKQELSPLKRGGRGV